MWPPIAIRYSIFHLLPVHTPCAARRHRSLHTARTAMRDNYFVLLPRPMAAARGQMRSKKEWPKMAVHNNTSASAVSITGNEVLMQAGTAFLTSLLSTSPPSPPWSSCATLTGILTYIQTILSDEQVSLHFLPRCSTRRRTSLSTCTNDAPQDIGRTVVNKPHAY